MTRSGPFAFLNSKTLFLGSKQVILEWKKKLRYRVAQFTHTSKQWPTIFKCSYSVHWLGKWNSDCPKTGAGHFWLATLNLSIFMHSEQNEAQSSLAHGFLCCHFSGESEARLLLSATVFPGTTHPLFVSLFVYYSGDSSNTDDMRHLRHTQAVHRQPGLLSTTVQLLDTSPVPTPFLCAWKCINLGKSQVFKLKKYKLANCGNKWNF